MKKIDFYIIRKFLTTFFFILGLLVIIATVIDFSEKVDNFIRSDVSAWDILSTYYFNFIPHISALLGPFFVLVAVVFFTSNLASRSEIIAMTSGGVSFYRLLLPYLVGAAILGGILYMSNHYWVPNSNKVRLEFELNELATWKLKWRNNIHRQLDENTVIYLYNYSYEDSTGNKFSLEHFEDNVLTYKLMANKFVWDHENGSWSIRNYIVRTFDGDTETFERGAIMDTVLNVVPTDFAKKISSKEEMTTPELKEYMLELKATGEGNLEYYELEMYRRTSSVFALIILTIIGYSLASRKIRGGLGVHIVTAIVIAALFELTMKFSTTFTTNASLHPFLGVWIPNFVFGALALVLIRFAQK